jgi:hypothetical protein
LRGHQLRRLCEDPTSTPAVAQQTVFPLSVTQSRLVLVVGFVSPSVLGTLTRSVSEGVPDEDTACPRLRFGLV